LESRHTSSVQSRPERRFHRTSPKHPLITAAISAGGIGNHGAPWPCAQLSTFLNEVIQLRTIRATVARAKLFELLDHTAESHEPIHITGKRSNAILISEDDWLPIQETLYLLSIPGMRESIRKGLKTPLEKCSEKVGWQNGNLNNESNSNVDSL